MHTLPRAALLLLISLLPAVAGAHGAPANAPRALAVELDDSARLVPRAVSYEWAGDALKVTGQVDKRYRHYGRIGGHVLIELLDADGAVLDSRYGAFTRFSPRRKDADRAYFAARLEQLPPGVVGLRLRHAKP